MLETITQNLIVESIEDNLPFWKRFGFEVTVSVPEGERLGFVILKRGATELMLQSRASLTKDIEGSTDAPYRSALYIRVEDLGPVRKALGDHPRLVPERTTFYGAREIIVRDPAGNLIAFAQHVASE